MGKMASPLSLIAIVLLGLVCVNGHRRWEEQQMEPTVGDLETRPARLDLIGMDIFATGNNPDFRRPLFGGPPASRPRPGPRPPSFFVGTYRSVPSRDWQINMYQVYNATGFPTDYVNRSMIINIIDLNNGSFHFIESADNVTFYNLIFQLDEPVLINGTNSTGDGQYTFSAARRRLSIVSNSTQLGVNFADIVFGWGPRNDGVNAVYLIPEQKIRGARHFRRVRRIGDQENDHEEDKNRDDPPKPDDPPADAPEDDEPGQTPDDDDINSD